MATSTIGLMCSALARRTATAMVMTYLTLLVLFVLPMGVQWYLQGISSITEEQLAALTVTSPFSAALSRAHAHDSQRRLDQPAARRRRSGPGSHHGEHSDAGLGDFPVHLPASRAGVFLGDLPGVSLEVVASGGDGVNTILAHVTHTLHPHPHPHLHLHRNLYLNLCLNLNSLAQYFAAREELSTMTFTLRSGLRQRLGLRLR